jgi:pimeloyl-ACP methyl ester carboxylesterase
MTAPVLLIHGLFGSLSDPALLSCFGNTPVLAPDLLGYGAKRDEGPRSWTLEDQADHVAAFVRERTQEPVHVVGHSIGGAVAVLLVHRHPTLARSLTSVEGNFTLGDAFWSKKISMQELHEIEAEVSGFRADVAAWVGRSGVAPTPFALRVATAWLDNQPITTLRTQARSVVAATGVSAYLDAVRAILDAGVPLRLVAGARARSGWNVPDWVTARAVSNVDIPNTEHLMMLEAPQAFADAVLDSQYSVSNS